MSENINQDESIKSKFSIESLPPQLAQAFTAGNLDEIEGSHIVYNDEKCTIWRCYEKNIHLANIGDVRLCVDYKKFNDKKNPPEVFDLIEFKYLTDEVSDKSHGRPIAEMSWYKPEYPEIEHPYEFNLSHRFVHPEFSKRAGLGTQLYLQAESFMQDIANQRNTNINLALVTVQSDVMRWVQKPELGYSPYSEEDTATLDELSEHPEQFETESVDYGNNQGMRDNFIYRKGSHPKQYVSVWFKKTIRPDTHI